MDDRLTPTPPVLVFGMHNAGTSMIAEVIDRAGIFFGADMAHGESHLFSIEINDGVILGDPTAWAKLPLKPVEEIMAFRDRVAGVIEKKWRSTYRSAGYDGTSAWGFKDPRLCVVLPLYLTLFPDARLVQITRDHEVVSKSLASKKKRGIGRISDQDHWRKLSQAYEERGSTYGKRHGDYIAVSYERFCRDPISQSHRLFEFLGLEMTGEMRDYLSSTIYADRIDGK